VDYKRFDYNGENYEVPPGKMLADSILKAVFTQYNQEYPCMYYELLDNLRQFLNGKEVRNVHVEATVVDSYSSSALIVVSLGFKNEFI